MTWTNRSKSKQQQHCFSPISINDYYHQAFVSLPLSILRVVIVVVHRLARWLESYYGIYHYLEKKKKKKTKENIRPAEATATTLLSIFVFDQRRQDWWKEKEKKKEGKTPSDCRHFSLILLIEKERQKCWEKFSALPLVRRAPKSVFSLLDHDDHGHCQIIRISMNNHRLSTDETMSNEDRSMSALQVSYSLSLMKNEKRTKGKRHMPIHSSFLPLIRKSQWEMICVSTGHRGVFLLGTWKKITGRWFNYSLHEYFNSRLGECKSFYTKNKFISTNIEWFH